APQATNNADFTEKRPASSGNAQPVIHNIIKKFHYTREFCELVLNTHPQNSPTLSGFAPGGG
ncbi:MAG: hypothetical protein ACQKBY_01415, partial [Verrucomicrobiales bacterium]